MQGRQLDRVQTTINRSRSSVPSSITATEYGPVRTTCGKRNRSWATPMIDPGTVNVVESPGLRRGSEATTPGVRDTGGAAAIAPVTRGGITCPKPFRKTVTVDPAVAGIAAIVQCTVGV